jgi:hypothetical protein
MPVSRPAISQGRRAQGQSRMAVALIVPTRRLISRPLLDWPEHDGRLGRVGSLSPPAGLVLKRSGSRGYTASARRIPNSSRLPWLSPSCEACSAGPASMSMGSCDDRITLYPAAPLWLATLLHARTIAREGWGSSSQRQICEAKSAMGFASHASDPPNAPLKERWNR